MIPMCAADVDVQVDVACFSCHKLQVGDGIPRVHDAPFRSFISGMGGGGGGGGGGSLAARLNCDWCCACVWHLWSCNETFFFDSAGFFVCVHCSLETVTDYLFSLTTNQLP